jgi:hypothetical protein
LHRQWSRLALFLDDGRIELTNNHVERELRKLVLGRNYAQCIVMRSAPGERLQCASLRRSALRIITAYRGTREERCWV